MFSSEDFRIESFGDLLLLLPIIFFLGFIAPFLISAYSMGLGLKMVGFLD